MLRHATRRIARSAALMGASVTAAACYDGTLTRCSATPAEDTDHPRPGYRANYRAPMFERTQAADFDSWRVLMRERLPAAAERDLTAEMQAFLGERTDRQLVWQTLQDGERMIRRVAIWHLDDEGAMEGAGRTKLSALVEVGDALNGHVGVVHGGFSAALLDDLLGQTTMAEARARGISGAPLTASLDVRYRAPVMGSGTYLVETSTDTVTPRQRPGPPSFDVHLSATIRDAAGRVLVEAKSRYVLKTFA